MTKTSSRSSSTTGSRREKVTKRKLSSSSSSSSYASSSDCSNNTNTNTLKSFTTSILPTSPTRSCNDNGVSNNSGEFVVEGHLWPRIQLTTAKKNKESPSCLSATTTTISASASTTTTMTSNNTGNNDFNATDFPSLMLPNMLHPSIKTTTTTTTMIDPATIPTKPVLDFKAITPTTKKRIMTKFSVPVTTGSMWPRVMGKTQRLSSKRYHQQQQQRRRRRGGGALKPIVSVD